MVDSTLGKLALWRTSLERRIQLSRPFNSQVNTGTLRFSYARRGPRPLASNPSINSAKKSFSRRLNSEATSVDTPACPSAEGRFTYRVCFEQLKSIRCGASSVTTGGLDMVVENRRRQTCENRLCSSDKPL